MKEANMSEVGLNKPVKLKTDLAVFCGSAELPRTANISKKINFKLKQRTGKQKAQENIS